MPLAAVGFADASGQGLAKARTRGRACGLRPKTATPGTKNSFSSNVRFADLVVMAERLHPIP
ncbi:hypothetical protein, partial [Mesorhizobium sp.]|uniref:hypothetical protein n=1 Tax=Mesorhizobium sp. TaxID=1871066 RepID=UPI0025C60A52